MGTGLQNWFGDLQQLTVFEMDGHGSTRQLPAWLHTFQHSEVQAMSHEARDPASVLAHVGVQMFWLATSTSKYTAPILSEQRWFRRDSLTHSSTTGVCCLCFMQVLYETPLSIHFERSYLNTRATKCISECNSGMSKESSFILPRFADKQSWFLSAGSL